MFAAPGCLLLKRKYELVEPLNLNVSESTSESWLAQDDYQNEFVIKLWPFNSDTADNLQRALWDLELRNLYRVSSSPGAEQALLVIQDAGVDHENKCFVMVMQAVGSGYGSLHEALASRVKYPWLNSADQSIRETLWRGLKQVAQGIHLLHTQAILHRDVSANHVFFHPNIGPSSFRLGGFEWSIRIGELHVSQPPAGWTTPPEMEVREHFGYRLETDWYGYGMLVARCLLNLEAYRESNPTIRHERVVQKIQQAPERNLSDAEKHILYRLIDRNSDDRLARDDQVIAAIDELLEKFGGVQPSLTERPLVLVYNPQDHNMVERIREVGFVPNPSDPDEAFNPHDISHSVQLGRFLQSNFSEAQIFYLNEDQHILVGRKLAFKIMRLERRDPESRQKTYTWDAAFCLDVGELSRNDGGIAQRDLPPDSIIVRTRRDIQNQPTILSTGQSWTRYLPQREQYSNLRAGLAQFHDFVRCTNQIDLLIRDAELFQYEIVSRKVEAQVETVEIREIERTRPVLDIFELEGGLTTFLQLERESNKPHCDRVVLTNENRGGLRLDLEKKIDPKDCYQVVEFKEGGIIVLKKTAGANLAASPPDRGWLRTFGLFGQMALIRRRKEAIDRLTEHSYLLKSISATGQVYMQIGTNTLPRQIPFDKVDEAKQAVMQDVLNTRPIYALQGPPGTGKTTMVAHLLRQILDEDPVAQILVTAQAHGAVDVLRAKVRNEAFVDIGEETRLPLAVRLGRNDQDEDLMEGSVESAAVDVLQSSIDRLKNLDSISLLQQRWRDYAQEMRDAIRTRLSDEQAPEFVELVRRGANITYCTTSAGDLEELARSRQTYDWAIIEEAGKCHAFDLALPMQAGHRWLLIGDHRQLPPYRFDDYVNAIADLDRTVEALDKLPDRASGLLDMDWVRRWDTRSLEERGQFKQYAKDRLETFRYVFELCERTPSGETSPKKTMHEPIGAIAGMLSWQYRMHPKIGDLISHSYYGGELKNKTIDHEGKPLERVKLAIAKPKLIRPVGIIWIDTPAASVNREAEELGPPDHPRYINPYEANIVKNFIAQLELDIDNMSMISEESPLKLAVLSPYNHQVSHLRRVLAGIGLPRGVQPKEQLRTRTANRIPELPSFVHTVDSFQGNEADVIIISLVRNNDGRSKRPLGFLDKPERMNVLLSRAQRLLVLVGSWDFFRKQVEPFALDDPSRQEWHLRKVIALLEEWFEDGTALKIDGAEFLMEEVE